MSGAVGKPVVRVDARAKVLGEARYSADVVLPGMAHAVLVTSAIARGRISRIDATAAEASPNTLLVLTHRSLNRPLGEDSYMGEGGHFQSSVNPLASAEIHYHGQIVAIVVSDTLEAAEAAAALVEIDCDETDAVAHLLGTISQAEPLDELSLDIGDVDAAIAGAAACVDAEYATAAMHQNPIELYSTTASWKEDRLRLEVPSQWIAGTQAGVAQVLGMRREDVTVASPFVGGAFGAKASVLWHTVLTAVAAERIGRPVKLVVSRRQGFTVGSFRPQTRHRVRLAADADGRLVAYEHNLWGQTSRADAATLPGTHYSTHVYASPSIRAREYAVKTDVNTPGYMRGPIEFPVNFAHESAIDELAFTLGIDPVEMRLRNEPERDPVTGKPYSSRSLVACYERARELFGWEGRTPGIGSMRGDDGSLIGWGCASAWYPTYAGASDASVRVTAEGAEVRIGAHDLGTGAYTVLRQIAADALEVPIDRVRVLLGSSDLPIGPMASGSSTTASAGSAVHIVCRKARELLGETGDPLAAADQLPDGMLETTARFAPRALKPDQVESAMKGRLALTEPFSDTHTMFSFGAQFAEVRVDPLTYRVTLGRLVGVFACGRIINPRTACSNLIGGMIWGAGHALMEEGLFDHARARFANTDLGSYHFAANADVPDILAETIDELDEVVNPLGVKGVGEIGVIGVAPAIASAIHHATGIRLRRTPFLIDQLLAATRLETGGRP